MLTHSFYAKALAVRRVTLNKGKDTPGVDGAVWSSPLAKAKAIFDLNRRGYRPQPLRRVNIKKRNGKLRPLGIPTMKDRAMQALYLMALDPIAETTGDSHSYGFRKHRCTQDAIEQCYILLSRTVAPQWVLEANIKGCFDHISHDWLLENIPMDKTVLRKWLKCGYIFDRQFLPTEEGTPQGGIISPTLANMAIDGLQSLLEQQYKRHKEKGKAVYPKVHLVRYADDFIITGTDKSVLENEVLPLVRKFLAERGLMLSDEKTKITHISEGFDFLGFNIRKFGDTLLTRPSKEAKKKFLEKIRRVVESNKAARQKSLIMMLNPIITGWGNYYQYGVSAETFHRMDFEIFRKVWQWARRRHAGKGKYWVKERYFKTINGRDWTFAADLSDGDKIDCIPLKRLSNIKAVKFAKIRHFTNPYDPEYKSYFEWRETYRMKQTLKGKESLLAIWKRQDKVCPFCGERIDTERAWSLTDRRVGERKVRILVHDTCKRQVEYRNRKRNSELVS